jgi:glycosyltransferase involved in cell wall biosynthesis
MDGKINPHAALMRTLLSCNLKRPYPAKFVLFADKDASSPLTTPDNVARRTVTHSEHLHLSDDRWLNFALPAAAREEKLDLFLSPYYKAPLALGGVKRINMIHDVSHFILPGKFLPSRYRSRTARWCLKHAMQLHCARVSFTLTVTEYSKRCLRDVLGLAEARIRVCPNGVDLALFREPDPAIFQRMKARWGLSKDYLLYVGANTEKKNVPGLLEAYSRLPFSMRARVPLVLRTGEAGIGDEVRRLKIQQNVVILPEPLSQPEMAALIGGATALALLSFDEGFGIPVAEAMAAGVPVVVSGGVALEEVVGDAGIVVDPANVEEAASALFRVLTCSKDELDLMSAACRARAQVFSADRVGDQLLGMLRDAV